MAGNVAHIDVGRTALALRRTQLETKMGEAIARAQKQYIQVQQPTQAPAGNGPNHLGLKVDIRV